MRLYFISIIVSLSILTHVESFSSDRMSNFESKQIVLDSSISKFKVFYPVDYRNDTLFVVNPQKRRVKSNTIFSLQEYWDNSMKMYDLELPYSGIIDIVDLLVNDNYYILLDLQNLWIFNRSDLSFHKKIELPNTLSEMRFAQNDNSIIEMSFCSISSFNKHKNTQTYAYKYNLRNDEGLYFAVDNPDNIEFTYVKRQLQSLCGNKFAVSNPLDYTIKIYTLNNTDTIIVKRLKEQWDNPKYSEITIDRNSPKKDIPNLMLVRDSLFMIETVDFIGSDTLIVQWSKPHFEESIPIYRKNYIDIWKINDKNAELISENIPDEEVYGEDGLYLPEIGRFRYKNGYLYSVKKIPFLTNKLPNGTDIRKMIDDYQIRNNFSDRYSVYLYKLK